MVIGNNRERNNLLAEFLDGKPLDRCQSFSKKNEAAIIEEVKLCGKNAPYVGREDDIHPFKIYK